MKRWRFRQDSTGALIREQVAKLEAESSLSGRAPSRDAIAELNDLESLAEARRRVQRHQWRPWLAGAGLALLAPILFLSAKRQTEATFVATVSAPTVHLDVDKSLEFRSIRGISVRLAGLEIDGLAAGPQVQAPAGSSVNVHILAGETVLQSFVAVSGTNLSVSREPLSNALHFHVECQTAGTCAGVHFLAVTGQGTPKRTPSRTVDRLSSARPVRLRMSGATADISIQMQDSAPQILVSDAEVSGLSFLDVKENPSASDARRMAWSGVQGGMVRLLATDRETILGEGEWVTISGSRLRLNRLVAGDSGITVQIRGQASELQTATGGYVRDLKPTLMEALVSAYQRKIQTAWAIVYIVLLFALRAVGFFLGDR